MNITVVGSAVDGAGNLYVAGNYSGTSDFDPSAAVYNLAAYGGTDGFISKFDASGNFLWARHLGGSSNDYIAAIAIDGSNNVDVVGSYIGTSYFNQSDTSTGSLTADSPGGAAFTVKYDSSGNYIWVKGFGYPASVNALPTVTGMAVDPTSGAVYTIGAFGAAIDFNPGAGVDTRTNRAGQADGYVQKLDSSGNYQWTRVMGNGGNDGACSGAVDSAGNFYLYGGTANLGSMTFFSTETSTGIPLTMDGTNGSGQSYFAKYNSAGTLVWAKSTAVGGTNIKVDASNNVYIAGYLQGTQYYNSTGIYDLDPGAGVANFKNTNGANVIAKYDSSGNYIWARQTSGTLNGFSVDANSLYSTGWFAGAGHFDPVSGGDTLTSTGGRDAYYSKWDLNGNFLWGKRIGGTTGSNLAYGDGMLSGQNGTIYLFGHYTGVINLGPTPCVMNFTALSAGGSGYLLAMDSNGNQFPKPAPTYTSISVTSGYTTGGTTTTFVGTDLWCTTSVTVDGNAATKSVLTDTSVSITTPVGTEGAKDIILTTPTGSVTASAAFTYVGRYTVSFAPNGATGGTQSSSTFNGGTVDTLPVTTTFTRTGFTFGGWSTTSAGTTPILTYSTHADTTVYAIWVPNSYGVIFNKNSVSATGTMATETANATTALTLNTFQYANHVFMSWNTVAAGTGTQYSDGQSYPFIAPVTLYAQWGYAVTYSSVGADTGTPVRTNEIDTATANLPNVGTMTRAGYTFGGWTANGTNYSAGANVALVANVTFNPVWTPLTYTISFNKNGADSGAVPGNQTWAESVTALTLSGNTGSLAKAGYTFGGWAVSASSPQTAITTYSTTSSTLTQTLYAIWAPISYTITYNLNNGDLPLPTQSSLHLNDTFNVAAAPTRSGYIFAGWSDSHSIYAANSTYRISTSNVSLVAQWNPVYTLHYILNGSLDTPTADTTTLGGTVLQLADTPTLTGYTFAGWLDSNTVMHAPHTNFTIIQNSNMTAQWNPINYTITYNTAGATSDTPTQSSLTINSSFVIAAAPTRPGYLFTGWQDSNTVVWGDGASYTVNGFNVAFTAQWSAISYSVSYDVGGGYLATLPTQSDVNIGNTFNVYNGTAPTWLAHTFLGWSDGTRTYAANAVYTAGAGNITLTAQFSLNGYTQITYAVGTGGTGYPPTQSAQLEGTSFLVASGSSLSRNGYGFNGWSDGRFIYQPGATYYVGPVGSPITLTAQWVASFSITYSAGAGTGFRVDSNSYANGDSAQVLDASSLSYSGYTFADWTDGTNTYQPGDIYTIANSNVTLTAEWTSNYVAPVASGTVRAPITTPPVEELTHSTPLTSAIVAAEVALTSDQSKAKLYFASLPISRNKSNEQSDSAPSAGQIRSVASGTSINTQVARTNSAQAANITLPATSVILSDLVVQQLAKQATVVATANGISVTPVAGFTGTLVVPTVATIDGKQVTVLNNVVVNPVAPVGIGYAPVAINKSAISWAPSASQVVSYQIDINGKTACQTTSSSCPVPALIGPKSKVTITAIGNDQTASAPEVIPYAATAPIPALKVNFATASATLSRPQKLEIAAIARVIRAQGFTRLVVNGFADARGSAQLNAKLSQARAQAVAAYMQVVLPEIAVKASAFGAKNAIAPNSTAEGQAQNRRTEIATW